MQNHSTATNWKRLIYFIFSLGVTAAIMGYLFSRVSLKEVMDVIRSADRRGVILFIALSLGMSLFRLWRYQIVLRASGHHPPSFPLFLIVLVRNFFSDLLPARLGTMIYIYMVTTRLGIPFGAAASSFALAFLFDMLALVPLIVIATLLVGTAAKLSTTALLLGGVVLLIVALAVLFALPWGIDLVANWFSRTKKLTKLIPPLKETATDLRNAKEQGLYGRLLALSLGVRLCKYGALYVFLFALLAPMGYSWADLEIPKVFIGLCASEIAASLPISGIAGFGAYEGAWALVFRLLGFAPDITDLTAVSHHLFTQVYGYGLGALALIILLLPRFSRPPN